MPEKSVCQRVSHKKDFFFVHQSWVFPHFFSDICQACGLCNEVVKFQDLCPIHFKSFSLPFMRIAQFLCGCDLLFAIKHSVRGKVLAKYPLANNRLVTTTLNVQFFFKA